MAGYDFQKLFNFNSKKHPEWHQALRKRIAELYANKKTYRELMSLVWDESLERNVFLDTDVGLYEKDRITIDDVVFFVMEHNENFWCADDETARKSFLRLKDDLTPFL